MESRTKRLVATGLGVAMLGLAGAAATLRTGRKVRREVDPSLDDPLAPPTDGTHHELDTHDGGLLHAVEFPGEGRPIVLLHGVTLQWWVWASTIALLRGRHRTVVWDMRGHGRSRAGSEGVTLEAAARDLRLLLERLDLRDAIVVGHSMGGMVLGRFSIQHIDVLAERVAGRVFLATSASTVSIRGLSGGLIGLTKGLVQLSRASLRNPRLQYPWNENDLSAAMVRGAFGRHPTGRMVEDVRTMLAEVSSSTLAEAAASIASHDVSPELGAVDGPTLVVVGERDLLTPPPHARALVRLVEGARLEEIPSVGHQVMQEAPDVLVDALDRFGAELDTRPRQPVELSEEAG